MSKYSGGGGGPAASQDGRPGDDDQDCDCASCVLTLH